MAHFATDLVHRPSYTIRRLNMDEYGSAGDSMLAAIERAATRA